MTAAAVMPETVQDLPGLVYEQERDLVGGLATAVLDIEEQYRYLLTRVWDADLPIACWVMLNPSTADARAQDNTLRRVVSFSHGFGAGGCAIVNLYAVRSRHPEVLTRHAAPVGDLNDRFIRQTVRTAAAAGGPVIAAWGTWGNNAHLRERTAHVRELLAVTGAPVQCLGTTSEATGHQPLHPLMLAGATQLRPHTTA